MSRPDRLRTPWWFVLVLLLAALPVFSMPAFLAGVPEGSGDRTMVWLFPVYVVVSAVCAWLVYQSNRALAWIIVALMVLSDFAMLALVSGYGQ